MALKSSNQERGYNMATKFYLAEIPDDFPATNVKFENMTKPLLAIPPKMVGQQPRLNRFAGYRRGLRGNP